MDTALLVYTTFPHEAAALDIGEALVRDGLAACVNVIPGMRSVYAWKNTVEHGVEVVAIIKSREGLRDTLAAALKERHPYETPIILFLSPSGAHPATLAWLLESTAGAPVISEERGCSSVPFGP